MGLDLVIIAVFVALLIGMVYYMIKHAEQVPDDYFMEEYELKLKKEIESENNRKAQ